MAGGKEAVEEMMLRDPELSASDIIWAARANVTVEWREDTAAKAKEAGMTLKAEA